MHCDVDTHGAEELSIPDRLCYVCEILYLRAIGISSDWGMKRIAAGAGERTRSLKLIGLFFFCLPRRPHIPTIPGTAIHLQSWGPLLTRYLSPAPTSSSGIEDSHLF
jgi:hypothetical protein